LSEVEYQMIEILFVVLINVGHGVEIGGALNQEFPSRPDCLEAKETFIEKMNGRYDELKIWCQPKKYWPDSK